MNFESVMEKLVWRLLPQRVYRRLPPVYYALNRYRFRWISRPPMEKETSKAIQRRREEKFFEKYFSGQGVDVGYGGDLVVPHARGWEIEHGDAHTLSTLPDAGFDFVYSSHLLEHLDDQELALRNWWRVLKPGGFLILYLPERDLAEKKRTLPSRFSADHKRFYLLDRDDPPDTVGLVPLITRLFPDAKIVEARVCDRGYKPNGSYRLSEGEYSIELVAKKC